MKNMSELVTVRNNFFLDNVIFYTVNELSTLVSDAKFALLPCHFKSGAHHDFAKGYACFDVSTF